MGFELHPLLRTNLNMVWGGCLAEVLFQEGVEQVVICPGSRSGPLVMGFVLPGKVEAIPVLDERSAAFFALGLARQSGKPVALVCTSGTAAANFLPAMVEASLSHSPLIVLTADRPHELRHCHSGQTINQTRLYGDYPNWQTELPLPDKDGFPDLVGSLRRAVRAACEPAAGPVHLNVPFRDPLIPTPGQGECDIPDIEVLFGERTTAPQPFSTDDAGLPRDFFESERGLILAGWASEGDEREYARLVRELALQTGWPVLTDGISSLRNHLPAGERWMVGHYDAILRSYREDKTLLPERVLQLGPLPTSKVLRCWLEGVGAEYLCLTTWPEEVNPLPVASRTCRLGLSEVLSVLKPLCLENRREGDYLKGWQAYEAAVAERVASEMERCDWIFEGKIPWLLSRELPGGTPVFISNSMPVRDAEFFWPCGAFGHRILVNRGANGIDGILSTALGVMHGGQPGVLITGDLAFLHDSNGLLLKDVFKGSLTILLINNGGGGIFEHLPVVDFDPPFHDFFLTPQSVNIPDLLAAHNIKHQRIEDWEDFCRKIRTLPDKGIRVLELITDPRCDIPFRRKLLDPARDVF